MYTWIERSALALALGCASFAAAAADGDLDTTYGDGGFRLSGVLDASAQLPVGMAMQPDGKILICGGEGASPNTDFYVARFTADGELDTTFNFDGRTTIDFGGIDDVCTGLALQSDGKIVVGGSTSGTGVADFAVARLNADGTLDTAGFGAGTGKAVVAFDLGGSNFDFADAVAIKADGKIVVAGEAATTANGFDFAVLQLNPDGSRDTSFNLTGRATIGFDLASSTSKDDTATRVAIDSAGRIVLSGFADGGASNVSDFAVARLLANGTPDPDFSADGKTTVAFDLGGATGGNGDIAYALALQRDGRILIAGAADSSTTTPTQNQDMAIARLLPDGSLDSSFGLGGRATIVFDLAPNGQDVVLAVGEEANGRIMLGGAAVLAPSSIAAAAVRLRATGEPDASFGTLGKRTYDFGQTIPGAQYFDGIAFTADNRIVYAGALNVVDNTHIDFYTARVLNDLLFASGFE